MSMYKSYNVRELLALTSRELDQVIEDGDFHSVVFDNGEVLDLCTKAETKYSHWFWEIFKHYPEAKVLPKHHLCHVLKAGGKELGTGTHLELCTSILKQVVGDYNLFLPESKEPLLELIYQTISDVMGFLALETEAYVISIDILDFVEIAHHPKVMAYKEEAKANPEKIFYAYEAILKEIKTNPVFDENGLAKAVRSNMVKMNQVMQCVAFRGLPSEVDGTIFKHPVWGNYVDGMNKFYDLVADSRTAAKSHFYSDSALKDSEYRARKFQLNAVYLERIAYEDCNSTDHIVWKVQGKKYDSAGTETYPGDLPMLIGKYYKVNLDDQSYNIIQGNEEHLVGKTILFRSVVDCKHRDPHAACHVCAGYLSQNISRFANVGHLGSVTLSKDFTQNILSIKHVNMSAVTLRIFLGDFEQKYLNTGSRGEGYYINKPARGEKVYLSILSDEAPGLLEVKPGDESYLQLSLPRISQVSTIQLTIAKTVGGQEVREVVPLDVRIKANRPMLTHEMLGYLSRKGWEVDEDNNFVFDMSEWDFGKPILILQGKEESFVDLADEVKRMVQSSQKDHRKRIQANAHRVLLQELFDVVNRKLRINILSMEILIYGLMTASDKSYALARGSSNPVLGIGDTLTMHRSLGAAMAFQGHESAIFEPTYFYKGKRPDSPMDVFLCPQEVIEAKYGSP